MIITVISDTGQNLGKMTMEVARKMAVESKKDLVAVNSKEGIYKIMDLGKLKYEKKVKERENKSQRTHKIKEVKFSLNIDVNDMGVKIKKIREFLEKGIKTKVTMQLKGRQQSLQWMGVQKMREIVLASVEGVGVVDKGPVVEGRNIVALLNPSKKPA
jgi:translation initiation factor IF-3